VESNASDPLAPQLEEAERTLARALGEACDARPLERADTGELIRIEEMLAIASEAAKRAISIRRRRKRTPPEGVTTPSEHRHREFTDSRGERWDVWAVYPQARGTPHQVLRGSFRNGWLCLETQTQKRRLSPIPPDWESMSDVQLEELCQQASLVPPRAQS